MSEDEAISNMKEILRLALLAQDDDLRLEIIRKSSKKGSIFRPTLSSITDETTNWQLSN